MASCEICLDPTTADEQYHAKCIVALFGTTKVPHLDFETGELYKLAAQMAGKMSISGVQEKLSLKLSGDKTKLEVAATGGRYILKPESVKFSGLPQNEHVTMRLASLVEIETPPFGLLTLKDETKSYIIKRFDRLDDGSKIQVEDFCQLAEVPPKDKYAVGSAELCVRLLRQFASEPLVEILKFYRWFLFGWWVANGDMHMKNFSLLTTPDGIRKLTPAYDLVNTRLVIPTDDSLAMMVAGRKKKLTRRTWLDFAEYCQIPRRAAGRLIESQIDAQPKAMEIIQNSLLPEKKKRDYEKIFQENTATLKAGERKR